MIRNLTRGAAHANRNRLLPVRRNTFRILHIAHQPHHRQSRASHTRAHPYATHSRHPAHTHRHRPREPTPARSRGPKTPDHHHSRPLPRASLLAPAAPRPHAPLKYHTPSETPRAATPARRRPRQPACCAPPRDVAAPHRRRGIVAPPPAPPRRGAVRAPRAGPWPWSSSSSSSSSSTSRRVRARVWRRRRRGRCGCAQVFRHQCAKMRIRARFARRLRRERASRGENVRIAFDRRGRRRALTARRATVARLRVRRWIYHCDGICFSVVIIGR